MASTILIGQYWGRKDVDGARRVFGTAAGAFGIVTILIAIAGWYLSPAILAILGTPGDAAPLALAYLRVIFMAMPALLLLTLAMMALRGSGDSMTPLWFMIVAVVLDSGLNPVFILGLGPAPKMGIAGSATATLIANYAALIGLLIYIYAKDLPLRLRGREIGYLLPDRTILKTIIAKGLPMGIQMIVISISALALVGIVNREGVDTAAAFGVAMLPKWFGQISPRFATPVNSIVTVGVLGIGLALTGTFVTLAIISSLSRLFAYLTCIAAVPRLDFKQGRTRWLQGIVVPAIAASLCVWAALQSQASEWEAFLGFLLAGCFLYLVARLGRQVS